MDLSERIKRLKPSSTLKVTQKANEMKNSGIDVISFSAGEPDFDTPSFIKEAAKIALDNGYTKYAPVGGISELKDAIRKNIMNSYGVDYNRNEIIVTCGAKAAIFIALQTLINNEDEVIIPSPYWVSYPEQILLSGGVPVVAETENSNNFKLTPESLEKNITNKTKIVILNSPNNPSGSIYSKDELAELAEVAVSKGIVILADEIYDHLVYDIKFNSLLNATKHPKEEIIYINGLSKSHAMTGWRIGFAAANSETINGMTKYQGQLYSGITTFVQKAAVTAFTGKNEEIEKMKREFRKRRDLTVQLASNIPDTSFIHPEGAFYLFLNVSKYFDKDDKNSISSSQNIADYLLEDAQVAVVPGSAFGKDDYIRLSFATSRKDIETGIIKIKNSLMKLKSV